MRGPTTAARRSPSFSPAVQLTVVARGEEVMVIQPAVELVADFGRLGGRSAVDENLCASLRCARAAGARMKDVLVPFPPLKRRATTNRPLRGLELAACMRAGQMKV
jgi:hypothetical protein